MPITGAPAWATIGAIIALVVLVVTIVFAALGQLELRIAALIIGLAIARLL
jgi:hypothetical protein